MIDKKKLFKQRGPHHGAGVQLPGQKSKKSLFVSNSIFQVWEPEKLAQALPWGTVDYLFLVFSDIDYFDDNNTVYSTVYITVYNTVYSTVYSTAQYCIQHCTARYSAQ